MRFGIFVRIAVAQVDDAVGELQSGDEGGDEDAAVEAAPLLKLGAEHVPAPGYTVDWEETNRF